MGTCRRKSDQLPWRQRRCRIWKKVQVEASRAWFFSFAKALIINHQSVLNFHPTQTVSSVCKAQLGKGGARGGSINHNAGLFWRYVALMGGVGQTPVETPAPAMRPLRFGRTCRPSFWTARRGSHG